MTSPFQIRQSNPRQQQGYIPRSIDTKSPCNDNYNLGNTLGLEYASFDSTRTDLSANSKDVIIAEQWVVLGRIGEGSFGEVFEVEDIDTLRRYAIKREPLKMRHPQLKHESVIYDVLAGGVGIPQCHWHGQHEGFDCIIIDLLGPSLMQIKEVTKTFSIPIVVELGIQMVNILEHIHKRGLVYRDIKPDNFLFPSKCYLPEPEMVEIPDDHGMPHIKYIYPSCEEVFQKWNEPHPQIYIVDFGLTTWWRNPANNQPYPEMKKNIKNKTGTARYASLNVHRGKTHSRRDDIEGMGYLLLDLVFGTLPWSGIQARNSRAGWDRMRQIKEDTFMSDLCAGLPQGLLQFIEYSRKIKFSEEPNYALLREFLQGCVNGGKYSTIVKSPFGGHTERKWVQDIDKDSTPLTREDMARPNSRVNQRDSPHHYAPPTTSRPRRSSYNQHAPRQHHADEADVFNMDDLHNNLPNVHESKQPYQYKNHQHRPHSGGVGGGPSAININYNTSHRRTSRDLGRNQYAHDSTTNTANTGPSSYKRLLMKNRKKQKRVGWNSHKHDEEPWVPETDWESKPVKPDIEITHASWGENKAENTWGAEEGSWAATVEKPWE